MKILEYLKASLSRKIARRFYKKYSYRIDRFDKVDEGEYLEYANWNNPLIKPNLITKNGIDFFKTLIPKGSFAIDIGANLGYLAVQIGIATGKEGLVLALEPNPQVFEGLTLNSNLNTGKYNIVPLQIAAANTDGEFQYASSEASISNGGLILNDGDSSLGRYRLKERVKTVKLSRILTENYSEWLAKLRLIKIDTEGFDLLILKDLKPILEKYHPIVITEVFHSKNKSLTQQERYEIFLLFHSLGYSIYNIENFEVSSAAGKFEKIPIMTKEEMPYGHTYNIIAEAGTHPEGSLPAQ